MRFKLTIATAVAAIVAIAALGSASSTGAAAKPGLPPGTWTGTGVISGFADDGGATTKFSGKLGFRIRVARDRYVKGTGSWVKMMKGRSEFINSDLTGIAQLVFAGPSNDIEIYYVEIVRGTIQDAFRDEPTEVHFQRGSHEDGKPLRASLVVTKLKRCSAAGTIPAGGGVTITWTAKPLGCKG